MKGMRNNEVGLLIAAALVVLVLWPVPTLIGLVAVLVTGCAVYAHASPRRGRPHKPVRRPSAPPHRVVGLGPNATAQDRRMYNSDASRRERERLGYPDDIPPF